MARSMATPSPKPVPTLEDGECSGQTVDPSSGLPAIV
jgi:hypothetical protein